VLSIADTARINLDTFSKNADYYENALYVKALGYHLLNEESYGRVDELGWLDAFFYFGQPMHKDLSRFYAKDPLAYLYAEQKVLADIQEHEPHFAIQLDVEIFKTTKVYAQVRAEEAARILLSHTLIENLPEFWQNKIADIVSTYLEKRGQVGIDGAASAGDTTGGSAPCNYLFLYVNDYLYVKEKSSISYDQPSHHAQQAQWEKYVISELKKNGLFFDKMKKSEKKAWLKLSEKGLRKEFVAVKRQREAQQRAALQEQRRVQLRAEEQQRAAQQRATQQRRQVRHNYA
jgi:hypothetical protein